MKKTVLIMLMALAVLSLSFAASGDSGSIQFKFKFRRVVAEQAELGFTNTAKTAITEYGIDLDKKLNSPQVYLAVKTNRVNAYNLKLSFSPMKYKDTTIDPSFLGYYKARVYDTGDAPIESGDVDYLTIASATGASISFPGDNVDNAKAFSTFYYPIAFQFSDYIEDYGAGDFEGTVTVELVTT